MSLENQIYEIYLKYKCKNKNIEKKRKIIYNVKK